MYDQMYDQARQTIEKWLRVPPEPLAPMGDEASLRVFRAAPNYYQYCLLFWKISTGVMGFLAVAIAIAILVLGWGAGGVIGAILALMGDAVLFGGFAAMALVSYVSMRLDYEYRWYKVTDRSLRIREGVFQVREMTMTFANIQDLQISQGPLQRLFNIADLKVKTAGGGGVAAGQQQGAVFNMHTGYFRGVDNAEEIRDLMKERLRHIRGAGLGDLNENASAPPATLTMSSEALGALRAVRDEAKAFQEATESFDQRR